MTNVLFFGLMTITVFQGLTMYLMLRNNHRHVEELHKSWNVERQQLLDRIQAPTYDHLKHHEAKLLKASKEPTKETNPLEVV
ncbi:hypothetical protein D3C78_1031790 [compost metagenome]